jgi:hypothetical protein
VLDKVYARNDLREPEYRVRGRAYGLRHGWAALVLLAGGNLRAAQAHLRKAAEADPAYVSSPAFARTIKEASAEAGVHGGSLLVSTLRHVGADARWVRRGKRSIRLAQALGDGHGHGASEVVQLVVRDPALVADRDLWAALFRRLAGGRMVKL